MPACSHICFAALASLLIKPYALVAAYRCVCPGAEQAYQ